MVLKKTMMGPKDSERREFVRVLMTLWAKASCVEEIPALPAGKSGLSGESYGPDDLPFDLAVGALADWLLDMDGKLDRILELLKGDAAAPGITVVKTIDLSGSGMSMILDRPVEIGQILKLTMKIDGFPLGIFRGYARVVRVAACGGQPKGRMEVGVQFLDLQESDRDRLIASLFRHHRHVIRTAQKTKSSGGSRGAD